MRKASSFFLYACLSLFFACSPKPISQYDKSLAMSYYQGSRIVADTWFADLDSTGYEHLFAVLPIKGSDITPNEIDSIIKEKETFYGKVTKRAFGGCHIWTGKRFLTWAPEIEAKHLLRMKLGRSIDGFYAIKPRYFGLLRSEQMFMRYPAGKYVMIINVVSTEKKPYAEEALTLWLNREQEWQVVNYELSLDI